MRLQRTKQIIAYNINPIFSFFNRSILELERIFVKKNLKGPKSNLEFALIVGCPRGGTTLLQTILSTHNKIISPLQETDFSDKKIRQTLRRRFEIKSNFKDIGEILKEGSKKGYILLKRPTAIFYLKELLEKFPNMKIIYIERNAGDNVLSLMKSHHFRWSFNFALQQWKAIRNIKTKTPKKNFIETKYEELVENPEEGINRILNYLSLEKMQGKEIIEFYKKIDKSNLPVKNAKEPITKKQIGKWEKELNENQKRKIKKVVERLLK